MCKLGPGAPYKPSRWPTISIYLKALRRPDNETGPGANSVLFSLKSWFRIHGLKIETKVTHNKRFSTHKRRNHAWRAVSAKTMVSNTLRLINCMDFIYSCNIFMDFVYIYMDFVHICMDFLYICIDFVYIYMGFMYIFSNTNISIVLILVFKGNEKGHAR